MEWINIHRSVTSSAEFKGSEPLDRATWFCLLDYCCGQENWGVIEGCGEWSDRKWQQVAGVTKAEVERVSELWRWLEGKDLEVLFYPDHAQKETAAKRRAAVNTNRKRRAERDAERGFQRDANQIKSNQTERNGTESGEREGGGFEQQKLQWAILNQQVTKLEQELGLTSDPQRKAELRGELKKNRAALEAIQKKQAAGVFEPVGIGHRGTEGTEMNDPSSATAADGDAGAQKKGTK